MSRIDDELDPFDELYRDWFEDDVEITNYIDGGTDTAHDEFDDPDAKQATDNSPIQATAQIDLLGATGDQTPWGREVEADYEVFINGVTISDGEVEDLPYPSDIKHLQTGEVYRIVDIHDQGEGHYRCLATNLSDPEDHEGA